MTNQREIILEELQKSGQHLTADELYDRVKKKMPRISLATVYRNLETLSEIGVISKLEISGRQRRFDCDIREHDHIHCIHCHRVDNLEFDRNIVGTLSSEAARGYTITGYRIEFGGICPACLNHLMRQKQEPMKSTEQSRISDQQRQILEVLAAAEGPCGTRDIAAATGLETKLISSSIRTLKKIGLVDSPVRCKYGLTGEGKAQLD
jgi:Fe2+ or Zn2+ uptake regulation protein